MQGLETGRPYRGSRHSEPRVFRKLKALGQEFGRFLWAAGNGQMRGVRPRVPQVASHSLGQDGSRVLEPLLRR